MKTLIPFLVLTLLAGCDTSSDKTPEQIQVEVTASQKKFALERERIEQENRAREARIAEQRSFVGASFVSVDSNRLEVLLRNNTDKSIDNQSGSLEIFDADGNYVSGIALTNWVPGDVYLPVGASARAIKSLELETTEQRDKIIAGAPNYQYHFTIHKIQFVDEDEINSALKLMSNITQGHNALTWSEILTLNALNRNTFNSVGLKPELNQHLPLPPECSYPTV